MRQYIAIFSFLILFLIPFSFTYADEEKYQNNSYGYSVDIPKDYSVTSPSNDIIILSSDKKNNSNGIDNISILVTKNNEKPFSEMIQLVKNDIENFGNEITDQTKIEIGNGIDENDEIKINQQKATLIKSHTINIGVPIFFENVVSYHGNLAYFITASYTDESTQNDFHKMLESFEYAQDDFVPEWIKDISAN